MAEAFRILAAAFGLAMLARGIRLYSRARSIRDASNRTVKWFAAVNALTGVAALAAATLGSRWFFWSMVIGLVLIPLMRMRFTARG